MRTIYTSLTWDELLAEASKPASPGVEPASDCEHHSSGWYGSDTYASAMDIARGGWTEGRERLGREFQRITAALPAGDQFVSEFDVAGSEVDVARFVDGEPECLREHRLEPRRRPVVKLIVGITASASVTAETLFVKGAAVAVAVDGLEAAGIRCEVESDWSVKGEDGNAYRIRVMVKRAEEPLDMDRMAFALCHASMLRRLTFRLYENAGAQRWRDMGGEGGYGAILDPEPEDGAAVIPAACYSEGWSSPENAAAKAKEIIAQLGGTV